MSQAHDEMLAIYREKLLKFGLSDCEYNVTAFELAYKMVITWMKAEQAPMDRFHMIMRFMVSDRLKVPTVMIGFHDRATGDNFRPMMMVMTSEFITERGLALYCGADHCSHKTCEQIPEDLRVAAQPPDEYVDGQFAPIVDSISVELADYDKTVQQFYVDPKEEGGE